MATTSELTDRKRPRVFVSYKRSAAPDEELARRIFSILSESSHVFWDQILPIGATWAHEINLALKESDFFIALISSASIRSEMVRNEIEIAWQIHKASGRPTILPVRIAFQEPLPLPLGAYLDSFNSAMWEEPRDTIRVIQELSDAVLARTTLPQQTGLAEIGAAAIDDPSDPLPFDAPHTAHDQPEDSSAFHVLRQSDLDADRALRQGQGTIVVRGPAQMGKSRLLGRIARSSVALGRKVVFIDLQLADSEVLGNPRSFFQWFCARAAEELGLEIGIEEYWKTPLGNPASATRCFQRYLLREHPEPLTIVVDELDTLVRTSFGSDFFSMLRSWHNNRTLGAPWDRVCLVLASRTPPYMWADNDNQSQSPFNVGIVIELRGFTSEQIDVLNQRYGSPLSPPELKELLALCGGQPFLTRKALHLVSSGSLTAAQLFRTADRDDGPFSEHLHYHYFQVSRNPSLLAGLRSVARSGACADELVYLHLMSAGLVTRESEGSIVFSNGLYKSYFSARIGTSG